MKKDRPRITDKSPNELPGVRKRSFILPFAGGEIWFEHLDGIYQYTPLAVQKLRADTAAFRRPSAPRYIAFVLDETVITEELISAITDALTGPGKRFMRVAFVGADGASDRRLKKLLCGHGFAIGSFDGIEPAKDWLLDEQRSKKRKDVQMMLFGQQTRRIAVIALLPLLIAASACSAYAAPGARSVRVAYPKFAHSPADGSFLRENISFRLSDAQTAALDKSVKLYRIDRTGFSDDEKKKIAEAFALRDTTATVDAGITNYRAGNRHLTLYPDGVFTFEIDDDTDRKDRPFDRTNEEVGQKAKAFLSSKGLLPDGFTLTDRFGEQGIVFEENGSEQNVVTAKGARFGRVLDGIEVIGTAKIAVMMNTDGICSVHSVYSRIDSAADVELIGIDEAIRRAKTADPLLMWESDKQTGDVTKAVVDLVKIVYYDDPLDERATHIQPCYFFEGTAADTADNTFGFSLIVPALAQEHYLPN